MTDVAHNTGLARQRMGWHFGSLLGRLGVTTENDGVKWSVALPLAGVAGGLMMFMWLAGGIAENVRNLTHSMDGIQEQFRIQGATLIRLDEGFKSGTAHMATQDQQISALQKSIDTMQSQLSTLQTQVERQSIVHK